MAAVGVSGVGVEGGAERGLRRRDGGRRETLRQKVVVWEEGGVERLGKCYGQEKRR